MKNIKLTEQILGLCIDIHKQLGPGLLESLYQQCLTYELEKSNLVFEKEIKVPVRYKGLYFEKAFRADIIVEKKVIIELKSVENILPIHKAQVLTYMKLLNIENGLLINFNVGILRNGINRLYQ